MLLSLIWIVLSIASNPMGEEVDWDASEVVTSYVNGTSPTLILGLDNNLEICLALREPKSVSELRSAGVQVTESQLILLRLWRLIERTDEGTLRCSVPIIEPPVTTELETLAASVSNTLLEAVAPDIDGYVELVNEAGWSESAYTLLGSYVLDGLVWSALESLRAIESADASKIPTGSEHWSGVTWITLPPQAHKLGTNSYPMDSGTLAMAWTPASLRAQEELRKQGLREELTAMASGRLGSKGVHGETLEQLGLVDGGIPAVPIIRTDSSICAASGELALEVARVLVGLDAFRQMIRVTGATNPSVALIMAYHWVYPRLMSRLEDRGLARPPAFDGVAGASLGPTLYVVESDRACTAISE
jgi:hypothetical protein